MNKIFKLNKKITSQEIFKYLPEDMKIIGDPGRKVIKNIANIENSNKNSLIFIKKKYEESLEIIQNTEATVIILDIKIYEEYKTNNLNNLNSKLLIFVSSPKVIFSKLTNKFLSLNNNVKVIKREIHSTAVISEKAEIAENVVIGAYTIIGSAKIGRGTVIGSYVLIHDNVVIGENVIIESRCTIGSTAYAEILDEFSPERINFPQLGGVRIGNNVKIGLGTTIQRGALQDTIIRKGVILDNFVIVAHNAEICEEACVIGGTHIGGSVKLGRRAFIGQSVTIANIGQVGERAFVGIGSVVIRPVGIDEHVFGNPARTVHSPQIK